MREREIIHDPSFSVKASFYNLALMTLHLRSRWFWPREVRGSRICLEKIRVVLRQVTSLQWGVPENCTQGKRRNVTRFICAGCSFTHTGNSEYTLSLEKTAAGCWVSLAKKIVCHPKKEGYGLALSLASTMLFCKTCLPGGITSL